MTTNSSLTPTGSPDESIDLTELSVRFLVEWRRFLLVAFVVFVLSAAFIYSIKPLFEASATILPTSKDDAGGLSSAFSGRSSSDVLIGLLGSRSVADTVIDRAGLMHVYKAKSRGDARNLLGAHSVFILAKGGFVEIKVRDSDAGVAERVANAYIDALQEQREKMLDLEAETHRRFFEQQLTKEGDALAAAEQELQKTQEASGIVQPEAQTTIGLNAIANVRSQITTLRVQLAAVRLGASEQNPEVQQLESEIGQLEAQQRSMESSASGTGAGAAAAAAKMPGLNLENARKLREVKTDESLLAAITNRYESTQLSEDFSGNPFSVVDRAIAPEHKAWPPRFLLLLLAVAFAGIAGVLAVGLTLVWRRLMSDPIQVERMQTLRNSFSLSR